MNATRDYQMRLYLKSLNMATDRGYVQREKTKVTSDVNAVQVLHS